MEDWLCSLVSFTLLLLFYPGIFWLTRHSAMHTTITDKSGSQRSHSKRCGHWLFSQSRITTNDLHIYTQKNVTQPPRVPTPNTLAKESSSRRHLVWIKCNYLSAPCSLESAQYTKARTRANIPTLGHWELMKHQHTWKSHKAEVNPKHHILQLTLKIQLKCSRR